MVDLQVPTLESALEVESNAVVSGYISEGFLQLTTRGGSTFGAGSILGIDEEDEIPPGTIVTLSAYDLAPVDVVVPEWRSIVKSEVEIDGPSPSLTSPPISQAWSWDGRFLAITQSTTPFLRVFKRTGDKFSQLPTPSGAPPTVGHGLAWSPDGRYLVQGGNAPPFINIYKRSGTSLERVANPSGLPSGIVSNVSWSPDGMFLIATSSHAPMPPAVYHRASDTFTLVEGFPSVSGQIADSAWSPDGLHLALSMKTQTNAPFRIFKREGTTFVERAIPAGVAPNPADGGALAWTPDGTKLAVAITLESRPIRFFQITPNTISSVSGLNLSSPEGAPRDISWSPDGKFLASALGWEEDPFHPEVSVLRLYEFSDRFTLVRTHSIPAVSEIPVGVAWSPDGRYMSIQTLEAPYLRLFKSAGVIPAGIPKKINYPNLDT